MAPAEPSTGGAGLTAEQERAVASRRGPLVLTAAAGSGKTTVLVERFVRAVREDGIPPSRILAITFTDRAAGELAERLRARLLELGEREAARDLERALVSTFHGFCARLLRAHARLARVPSDLAVLDEGEAFDLRQGAFEEALGELVRSEGEAGVELLAAYEAWRLREMVLSVYDELRSRGEEEPSLPPLAGRAPVTPAGGSEDAESQSPGPGEAATSEGPGLLDVAETCRLLDRLLCGFGVRYQERKRVRGAVDFDDLELRGRRLLREQEAIRRSWRERFELLMVDELQDVNRRQLDILEALDRDNLFTVGDELQSIYGFRHADVRLFAARRDSLSARGAALALTHNFRSSAALLEAVNAIFGARLGAAFTPLLAGPSAARPPASPDGLNGAGARPGPDGAGGPLQLTLPLPELDPGDGGRGEATAGAPAAPREAPSGSGDQDGTGGEPVVELLLTDRFDGEERVRARSGPLAGAAPGRQAEARMLAQRIADLVACGARPGDVVVLLRATVGLAAYAQALSERGLPVQASVGSFWERPEVRDLLAYLRLLANPLDEEGLYGVLASPLAGLSSDALALIAGERRGAWDVICDLAAPSPGERVPGGEGAPGEGGPAGRHQAADSAAGGPPEGPRLVERMPAPERVRLVELCRRALEDRRTLPWRGIAAVLNDLAGGSGPREALTPLGGERAAANLRKLLRTVRRFERDSGPDVRAFLEHVRQLRHAPGPEEPEAWVEEELEAVRVMTVHAAKGLEFPVVCVAELGAKPTLRPPELLVEGERIGLRMARLGQAGTTPELDYAELGEERRAAQEAEEDRILYVALTRARERLILSGASSFAQWPAPKAGCPPLAWLAPALVEDLPGRLAVGMQPELAGERAGSGPDRGQDGPPEEQPVRPGGGVSVIGPGGPVRLWLNSPPALGRVLRTESLEASTPPPSVPAGDGARSAGEVRMAPTALRAPAEGGPPGPGDHGAPGGQHDFELPITYTALAKLESCGYRYYLEEVLGLPEPPPRVRADGNGDAGTEIEVAEEAGSEEAGSSEPGALSPRLRGRLVHAVLESLDFAAPGAWSADQVRDVARTMGCQVPAPEADRIAARVRELGSTEPGRRLAGLALERELPFAFVLDGHEQPVTGVIDLLAREEHGRALVVDYKSDRVSAGQDLERLVERDYASQRLIYALASLRSGVPGVEVAHWFLERPGEWVVARFEQGQMAALERDLRGRIERARMRGWAVSEVPHRELCRGCPGRGAMCSWSYAATARRRPDR